MAFFYQNQEEGWKRCLAKIYKVTLTNEERAELTALVSKGNRKCTSLRRARILLMADEAQEGGGWKDADIAKALNAHVRTVERTTRKMCLKGRGSSTQPHTTEKDAVKSVGWSG